MTRDKYNMNDENMFTGCQSSMYLKFNGACAVNVRLNDLVFM